MKTKDKIIKDLSIFFYSSEDILSSIASYVQSECEAAYKCGKVDAAKEIASNLLTCIASHYYEPESVQERIRLIRQDIKDERDKITQSTEVQK